MRTELSAISTVNANHWFIDFIIPENCPYNARITAMTTTYTFCSIEKYATSFLGFESISWTYF
jgi:hypothetical protein